MARSYWLIWDAASKDVTDKLLEEEVLPNLKQIISKGIYKRTKSKQLNCQTPCALAVQFSGRDAVDLGVAGYNTPLLHDGLPTVKYVNSFQNNRVALYAPWNNKNIRNKKIALCQIPYAKSFYKNIMSVECYKNLINSHVIFCEEDDIWEKDINHSISRLKHYIYGDIDISIYIKHNGMRSVSMQISISSETFFIKLSKENDFMEVIKYAFNENIETNLFVALKENGNCLFLFSDVYDYDVYDKILKIKLKNFVGPFQGKGYGRIYRNSGFGLPKYQGGSGRAEKIFMFIVRIMANSFLRLNKFFINDTSFDIVISYQPCIDEVSHEFYGRYFNSVTGSEKDFYWRLLKRAYILADQHLGVLIEEMGEQGNIIVSSDHGIYSVSNIFYINSWLRNQGLLWTDCDGNIDIKKSYVFYHPAENGALYFDKKIEKKLLQKIMTLSISGYPIVKEIVKINDKNRIFGDVFLIPHSGMSIEADINNKIFEKAKKTGSHTANVGVSSIDGIFIMSSSQMIKRFEKGDIYNTDIKEMIDICFQNF